ncbi:MAG TPA: hypothetical protein PLA72_09520 [Smithellaceae bacterium]|nr:hypothetical protein [Smithellaceae bacterium]
MAQKECPFCKETIQEEATICKHCKSQLPLTTSPPPPEKKWYKTWKGLLLLLFVLMVFMGIVSNQTTTKPTNDSSVTIKKSNVANYENDLTERCKDWIYQRNRAYKLGKEGDQKGAEKARIAMLTFMRDLQKNFTEKQISDEIARLEASGYKAGF